MRVRELNAWLHDQELALPSWAATTTRQSPASFRPRRTALGSGSARCPTSCRSLDVVAAGGGVHRIERDRRAHRPRRLRGAARPTAALVQDDHGFDAAVVGMGCMGVITRPRSRSPTRTSCGRCASCSPWADRSARTSRTAASATPTATTSSSSARTRTKATHYRCMVRRATAPRPAARRRWHAAHAQLAIEVAPDALTPHIINLRDRHQARRGAAARLEQPLGCAARRRVQRAVSYKVFNIGAANQPAGVLVGDRRASTDGSHLLAVEEIFEVADRHRRLGSVYQSSPIALRFVQGLAAPTCR